MHVLNILVFTSFGMVAATNTEMDLHNYLFNSSRYNPSIRPRFNFTEPVELTLTWTTGYILNVEEREGVLALSVILLVEWSDDFLTWDPSVYGGIQSIVVSGKSLWTPILSVTNNAETSFLANGFTLDKIRVYWNGRIEAEHAGVLKVLCNLDVRKFPFDRQSCVILIQNKVYNIHEVTMKFSIPGTLYIQYGSSAGHPVWEMKDLSKQNPIYGSFATIYFDLQRKSLYYTCTMITPSVLLTILTLGAFFIPNNSGEKISCGLAIFLSFVVFLIQMGDIVPVNSNGISVIVTHYMLCMIGSAIFILHSVLQTFIVVHNLNFCALSNRKIDILPEDQRPQIDHKLDINMSEKSCTDAKVPQTVYTRNKCSVIFWTDTVSFLICCALNIAGYALLLNTYMNVNT